MSTIITRASKGSALTYAEMDANFNNLNTDKLEAGTSATNIANTPSGNIVATNVQSAINELDTEKLPANATSLNGTTIPANETLVVTTDISSTIMPWVVPGTAGNILTSDGSVWTSSPSTTKQIQSISASVGSNALTISASYLSLDFRSTTLGSGTVTTVSGTPSNLVISSGSTLGTISAQISRIIILAINNSGTIELAAVNIAGGNNLSETELISTTAEGGAGGADSANVIYSTTARTNVAYRVIGYVESTQTTAGTWATAPSTIQGIGGQALSAMSSLGYAQTWQNVIASRAYGTTYYNTTSRPIYVAISNMNSTSANDVIEVFVSGWSISQSVGSGTTFIYSLAFIVPPGASYRVTNISGGTIRVWSELR